MSDRIVAPLGPAHRRDGVNSGVPALDRYLHTLASQDARRRVASVYVLCEQATVEVIAYYTLSAFSLERAQLPGAAFVLVHASDESVAPFDARFGFEPLADHPLHLFLPMVTIGRLPRPRPGGRPQSTGARGESPLALTNRCGTMPRGRRGFERGDPHRE